MQGSRLSKKGDEIQGYADKYDSKRVYNAVKTLYGPHPSGVTFLLSADRANKLTEKFKILERPQQASLNQLQGNHMPTPSKHQQQSWRTNKSPWGG